LAADDGFEFWFAVVELLFGGGNDGTGGPAALLVLMLDWAVLGVPLAGAEDLSIAVRESCGVCGKSKSTEGTNEVKNGDWICWGKKLSL
jgi:hypothetical protein